MIRSTSPVFAFASSAGLTGIFEKSGSFTLRTARSVVWAERIVRISTSNGMPRATVSRAFPGIRISFKKERIDPGGILFFHGPMG